MKSSLIVLTFLSIFATKTNCTDIKPEDKIESEFNKNPDELVLRKMSLSRILNGVVNTCLQVAQLAGSTTVKQKQASTCNLVASVIQFAAEATEKHKKPDQNKLEKASNTCNNSPEIGSQKENAIQATESTQAKEENKQAKENIQQVSNNQSETKTIDVGYLQLIQNLGTDEEKSDLINKILQNREDSEMLIDEINMVLKSAFIDSLFAN
jgi:type IV secretory pathway VirB10-like protein